MKRTANTLRPLLVALALAAHPNAAPACAIGGPVAVPTNDEYPDLPLDHFVAGHPGVIRAGWSPTFLAVAYRLLDGAGVDPAERDGAFRVWAGRFSTQLSFVTRSAPSTPASPQPSDDPVRPWRDARAAVLGPGPSPTVDPTFSSDYALVTNCLPDAFVSAAATLEARVRRDGRTAPSVRAWIDAQDQVFANCSRDSSAPALPAPLPASASSADRADRDYQIAAAYFYAGDFTAAETRFTAIAHDPASPWAPLSRYLVARTLTRRALLGNTPHPDAALLRRASAEMHAVLADPALAAMHHAAARYDEMLQVRLDPVAGAHAFGVRLARGHLGPEFGDILNDYAYALEHGGAGALDPAQPASDRLSAFVSILRQDDPSAAFARALHLYRASTSPVWLVAALVRANNAADPALTPLLADAARVPPAHPAYATVQYHRARILLARGQRADAWTALETARAALSPDDGPTARNRFIALAWQAAPDEAHWTALLFTTPAGYQYADDPATPQPPHEPDCTLECSPHARLHPDAAVVLERAAPLSLWARVARASVVPAPLRARLLAQTVARAVLLGDDATADALLPAAITANPAIARWLTALRDASTPDARRFALLDLVAHAALSVHADPRFTDPVPLRRTGSAMLSEEPSDSAAPAPAVSAPVFLTATERTALAAERARLDAVPPVSTWLASESARLAPAFVSDPRTPELLHLAVVATRYGTHVGAESAASRAAFSALHRLFPHSPWTRRTRYSY